MQAILVILAAGMGSRYGGLKQLDGVGPNGETIMDYSVYDAARAGFGKVVFIIRKHFRAEFEAIFSHRYPNIDVAFVEQEPYKELPEDFVTPPERTRPWGTGHAMLMAEPEVNAPFCVINADDFYGREAFTAMGDFLRQPQGRYAMVGYQVSKTLSESGAVSRGICSVTPQGILSAVTECHQIQKQPDGSIHCQPPVAEIPAILPPDTPVSMNFWGFRPDIFAATRSCFHHFLSAPGTDLLKAECYIPSVVNQLVHTEGRRVQVLSTGASWFGVTYQEDRPYVSQRIAELIAQGVYPHKIIL